MKIARRFNAGMELAIAQVPKGRLIGGMSYYIKNQPEHHRIRIFQEEFLILLKKHQIKYDELYCGIDSAVPSGLGLHCLEPGVKTPGYYRTSLRDNRSNRTDQLAVSGRQAWRSARNGLR